MSLIADTTPGTAKAVADAQNNVIPAGTYEVTVAKAEVKPFSQQGAYASKKVLNVQLRVVDDAPTAAKRITFLRVPLFDRWNPSAKYPDGYPVLIYRQFFKAVGATAEQIDSGNLPGIPEISGKRLTVKLSVEEPDEYHTNDDGDEVEWNDVKSIKASAGAPSSGGVPADVWGTPAPAAPAPAADVWAPAPEDAAFAAQQGASQ